MRIFTSLNFFSILSFLVFGSIQAQNLDDPELFLKLKEKDSLLFSVGFNQCDIDRVESMLNGSFEFYHDKDGMIGSKDEFLKILNNNLCSTGENVIQRKLDDESLEVFPLFHNERLYGALQNGIHYFGGHSAKFSHLWLLTNGEWQLSRVVSYAHVPEKLLNDKQQFIEFSPEMTRFLGNYQFSPDFTLSIILEGERLYGDAQGQKVEIKPTSAVDFVSADATTAITFKFGESGDVVGLMMTTPEGEMQAQKVE